MGMEAIHPPVEPLRTLLDRLQRAGITAALGGSGLLFAHGLVERVNDWDLTTDAAPEAVITALHGLRFEDRTGGRASGSPPGSSEPLRYATGGRFVIHLAGAEIDLICQGAVTAETGVCHLPSIPSGHWQGLPLDSLEVWAAAYWLIGRPQKSELVLNSLRRNGADPVRLERILAEPLPLPLHTRLAAFRSLGTGC